MRMDSNGLSDIFQFWTVCVISESEQSNSQVTRHMDIDGLIKANYPEQTQLQSVIDIMLVSWTDKHCLFTD